MNLSELFIRRPVLTILLNAAIVVAGAIAFNKIPVAALPSYNTPVINVSAQLPGASPETMATSVALQLEKQFQTIPGLAVISSSNTLGVTSVTLEFDQGRDIDAAAVDVQAALLRAQRTLPVGVQPQRHAVREVYRNDMGNDDRAGGDVPDGARVDESDPDEIVFRAKKVPAEAEGIGGERDQVLAVEHEQREVVRHRVRKRDRHE